MRFVKYKKKKIDELVDDSLNIIDGDEKGSTSIIKSKETTDQNAIRTRQRRDPLAGYNTGGAYGYYFGEGEEDKAKAKKIVEDLLSKASDSYDVQDTNRLKEIPSLESLEKHHPIVGRNTRILVNSIKSREGVDSISDAIILNELISLIDVESIPYDLKKILIRKLQGGGSSNIVNESINRVSGKLILVKPVNYGNGNWYGETTVKLNNKEFHPVLIDENNPIMVGDEYIYFGGFGFSEDNYYIRDCVSKENAITANSGRNVKGNSGWKILAMPDEFPKIILNKIETGELKNLDNITFIKK